MMMEFPILSTMILLPLIAGIVVLFLGANGARWLALLTTLAMFALGISLWLGFDVGGERWQYQEFLSLGEGALIPAWALGIDGIALLLIVLSTFLMPICIGASWRAITNRVPEYMSAFLLMEAL
ncbi:MAG: NADH-quinone oxidoreductase subunit M, partial [Sphingomonadaceae bacterium]